MFIQTERTPNPNTMKFLPGETVLKEGTATFRNREDAMASSPLASILFQIPNIEQVFFGSDFITVTKAESADWQMLKAHVLTSIMDHFISNKPVMNDDIKEKSLNRSDSSNAEDTEIVKQIKELIDTRVRPAVAEDGGDIIYQDFRDGVVYLELHGACSGCPSSTATLKGGIENMLKHYIPEVIAVEAVNGYNEENFDL
ncbi:MAG TPA: NifU family protein [Alphaproteobacteria bacterium]|nr:NifU family protein [Alphaproteobacteria bacterium]